MIKGDNVMNMKCGYVEYKMDKALANQLIRQDNKKRRPQEVLCDYVNTEYGLLGYCVRVIITE